MDLLDISEISHASESHQLAQDIPLQHYEFNTSKTVEPNFFESQIVPNKIHQLNESEQPYLGYEYSSKRFHREESNPSVVNTGKENIKQIKEVNSRSKVDIFAFDSMITETETPQSASIQKNKKSYVKSKELDDFQGSIIEMKKKQGWSRQQSAIPVSKLISNLDETLKLSVLGESKVYKKQQNRKYIVPTESDYGESEEMQLSSLTQLDFEKNQVLIEESELIAGSQNNGWCAQGECSLI